MNKGFDDQLQEIERATLTPLVQRALKSETAEPIDWEYDTLLGGAGDMGMGLQGVFRFRGTARIRDRDQEGLPAWIRGPTRSFL